jgi:fatty-acyl-CoA synthase
VGPKIDDHAARNAWIRALERTAPIGREALTFPQLIETLAEQYQDAPALCGGGRTLTYRDLAAQSNRYARWASGQGIGPGSVVAILVTNCAEYVALWLGITRIGGIAALLNTRLPAPALTHAIAIAAAGHVIVGIDLAETLEAALPNVPDPPQCWVFGGARSGMRRLDSEVSSLSGTALPAGAYRAPALSDWALYIYTSGTTGLPKAARISHMRVMQWTHWFAGMMGIVPADRLYNCLPMYHSIGGVVAVGAPLVAGASVLIRDRFTTAEFWNDVVDGGCTLFQYVGELCRYLMAAPPHPRESDHRLRLCCGNGLRAEVWRPFQERFRIPQILEYYAATEGSFSLYNCEGKPGAIGRIPSFLAHRFPIALIRYDPDQDEPLRGPDGFCFRCDTDETGEAIGRTAETASGGAGRFEGYTDRAASERKILRNVFAAGDCWYRTGDLMRRDKDGFFYFADRIGDTFRWKGENVSTAEVSAAIEACPGVIEAVAYGVTVPGTEGRAGMAAVVAGDGFELASLRRHLAELLPDYARPLFLRRMPAIPKTETFKPKKQELAREGYDPSRTTDPIYVDDRECASFVRLDRDLYERLRAGTLRL